MKANSFTKPQRKQCACPEMERVFNKDSLSLGQRRQQQWLAALLKGCGSYPPLRHHHHHHHHHHLPPPRLFLPLSLWILLGKKREYIWHTSRVIPEPLHQSETAALTSAQLATIEPQNRLKGPIPIVEMYVREQRLAFHVFESSEQRLCISKPSSLWALSLQTTPLNM